MKYIKLGKTGIEVSKVGFGVLTMGKTQVDLPLENGADVIAYALSKGINFFDTAEYYETYRYMKAGFEKAKQEYGLTQEDIDRLVVSTKSFANTAEWMEEAVKEALDELGRDHIDIFLLHEVRGMWDFRFRRGAWEVLKEYKKQGIIRAIGCSTHHCDVAAELAAEEECDIVFPLYNYAGLGIRKGDEFGTAEEMKEAIATLSEAGKGIYTMKAFGGGNLTVSYQEALNFVYGTPGVESVMIGMAKRSEVDDIVSYLDGTMSPDYQPETKHKQIRIDIGDCEGCGACVQKCNSGALSINPETEKCQIDNTKCVTCGYCAPVCPERAIIMF